MRTSITIVARYSSRMHPSHVLLRRTLLLGALLCSTRTASGQVLGIEAMLWPPTPPPTIDTAHPPAATRPVAYRSDALLPGSRIIAFYGTPLSTRMGILGEIPRDRMMAKLDTVAAEWARVDSTRTVRPALHLIVTVAQPHPGGDGMFRLRHGSAVIDKVIDWADSRGWLVFLDIQIGRAPIAGEIDRLLPWLARPNVHLAIDPEFAMPPDGIPGRRIGRIDGSHVNLAIDRLADLVTRHRLPPKVLVVHRFTEGMLTNHGVIRSDPRVQVVIHMDGFGGPGLKRDIYRVIVEDRPVQFAGLKLFYKNDKPMLTPAEIVQMLPTPVYIQYQ
jgi:hypothetical protein